MSLLQKLFQKYLRKFFLTQGRQPQTPKEWMDIQDLAVREINKKLKKTPKKAHVPGFTEKASVRQDVAEEHAQEVLDIYKGKK